jgi:hypothetical protein
MTDINQNPEQKARDKIDALLEEAGWKVSLQEKLISMPVWASPCANIKPMLARWIMHFSLIKKRRCH